jgi:capsular exopolysaccharide synthesis family protein
MPERDIDPAPDAAPRKQAQDLTIIPAGAMEVRGLGRGSAPPRDHSQPGLNLWFILNSLRRWWMWALPSALLLTAIGVSVVVLTFEKKYEAESWIRIENRTPWLVFPSAGDQSAWFAQTETAIVRSPMVLGKVVERPDIATVPWLEKLAEKITALSREVKVTSVGGSELYRITFACNDPDYAKNIVNAVTEAYFEFRDTTEGERSQKVIELLEKEKGSWQQEVIKLRKEVLDLAKQGNGRAAVGTNPNTDAVEKRPLVDWHSKLSAATVNCLEQKARLQVLKEELEKMKAKERDRVTSQQAADAKAAGKKPEPLSERDLERQDALAAEMLARHHEINRLSKAIEDKQAYLRDVVEPRVKGGKDSPVYKEKEAEIARDREHLERRKAELRPEVLEQANQWVIADRAALANAAIHKQQTEVDRMELEIRGLENVEAQLKVANEKEVKAVNRANVDTLDLEFKRDELARAEKVFEQISQRTLQLQTEQRAPARVTLMQYAARPNAPIEVFPWKKVGMVGLLCMCLPFGLAVGWERLVRRIGGADDLEQVAHLTVLGEIARLPTRMHGVRRSPSAPTGLGMKVFQESVDSLRTNLTLSQELRDMRLLAITSASCDEGKTSIATQLAISLARASSELVLLIDGDMRSPDIHHTFGIPLEPGLVKVLKQECSLEEAIVTTWSPQVHLLPAGRLPGNPHRLLANGAWEALLAMVPHKYRYVIIDTPPVLAASEALVLSKAADATLICAMRDVSRMAQVRLVYDRLVGVGGHPAGIVLNGVPARHYAYRYGTYT